MNKIWFSCMLIILTSPALAAESGSAAPTSLPPLSAATVVEQLRLEAAIRHSSRITRDASGKVITTAPMGARGGAPTSTGGAGALTIRVPEVKAEGDRELLSKGRAGLRSVPARDRSPGRAAAASGGSGSSGGAAYEGGRTAAPVASVPSPAPAPAVMSVAAAGGSGASSSSPAVVSGTISILATDDADIEAKIGKDFLGWFNGWKRNKDPYKKDLRNNIRARDPSYAATDAELEAFMVEFSDARLNRRSIEVPIRYTKP